MAIAAAEHGLRIMGAPMALWLVHHFLEDKQFREATQAVQISHHDWLLLFPAMPMSWPPGTPPRVTNLPPVRIDPRYGLRLPKAKQGRPRKHDPDAGDQLLFDAAMPVVQAMTDNGQRLGDVLRGFASQLASKKQLRPRIEQQLYRAWWRHRKQLQKGASQPVFRRETFLHDFSRR
jgi:hypothetical protein